MELNKNVIGKNINIAKIDGPVVGFKYDITDKILKKFFCVKRNTNVVLGKVLAQFGYTRNDFIYLTDILYKDNNIIISYDVNGKKDKNNKINIEYSDLIYKYKIGFNEDNKEVFCKVVVFDRRNINFNVSQIKEKLDNGNVYYREYNPYYAVYKVVVNNIEVELNIKTKLFDEYGTENILILEKEQELENYIKNIDISKGIENIYKDIVGYIGDVLKYLDIKICITELDKKIGDDNKLEPVVTDMICVKNGVCEQFMVTRGNKSVSIDKDGNAVCRYNDEFVEVTTLINEYDGASYNIKSSNEIVLREQVFIHGVQGLENAIDEIDEVKERVLRLIPKKK